MQFIDFTSKIDVLTSKELGGQTSQFKMVPKTRLQFYKEETLKSTPKKAAVLAFFYPNENKQTCFLLTKRASYKGTHSAQVSFPGGKIDIIDKTLKDTALRETYEEVGIPSKNIKIIRALTKTYIPPSNFLVSPFIGMLPHKPLFKINEEVDTIIEVLLDDLLNNSNLSSQILKTSYMENMEVPCFKLNNYVVWGATAMILSEIKDLIK